MRLLKFIFSKLFICIFLIAALCAAITFLCVYVHSVLPAAAAVALAYAIGLAAALSLLFGESPSEFKCAWLIAIVALPVCGAVLYFLSYLNRCQRCDRTVSLPQATCFSYEYFNDGAPFLDRLISLVSSAKNQVYLEFYIISKGHIWGALRREIENALKRGVKIKIIYDALGSAYRAPLKDFKKLKEGGAEIKVFNKLRPLPVSRLNFRDHRKIAVIDDEAVFLGGVNVADEYANLSSPHGHWKDGGALFFGQIAAVYSRIFLNLFEDAEFDFKHVYGKSGNIILTPVADEPECRGSVCEDDLARAICAAEQRIYVFTPYLCMGDKLHDAVSAAARRGTDVKIIIPHVPDKKFTYAITKTYCEKLIKSGVQVYTYTPGFMHFKGVVCDDVALLGSYNFDFRSMRLNYECGVWGGEELAGDIAKDFTNCLALCERYEPKKRGALARAAGKLLCLFAPLV